MSDVLRCVARGPEATEALGRIIGRLAQPGLVLGLTGPLGAGKTTFVRGLAEGLDVPREVPVTSPTFALVQHYPGRLPLVHVDAYRLAGTEDLRTIDAEDWLGGAGVTAVEWADRVASALPVDTVWCRFEHKSQEERGIVVEQAPDDPPLAPDRLHSELQLAPGLEVLGDISPSGRGIQ